MADDARTHAGFFSNLELIGASVLDLAVDSPVIIYNKATDSSVGVPLDLGAKVYADQTTGLFLDANGNPLTSQQIEQGAENAEGQGAVADAASDSASQLANDPLAALKNGIGPTLDLIPTWAKVAAVIVVSGVVLFYVIQAGAALKTLKG